MTPWLTSEFIWAKVSVYEQLKKLWIQCYAAIYHIAIYRITGRRLCKRNAFLCEHVHAHHLLLDLFSRRQLDSTIEEDQSRVALACHNHEHQTTLFHINLA